MNGRRKWSITPRMTHLGREPKLARTLRNARFRGIRDAATANPDSADRPGADVGVRPTTQSLREDELQTSDHENRREQALDRKGWQFATASVRPD